MRLRNISIFSPTLLIHLALELLSVLSLYNVITCILIPPIQISQVNPTARNKLPLNQDRHMLAANHLLAISWHGFLISYKVIYLIKQANQN